MRGLILLVCFVIATPAFSQYNMNPLHNIPIKDQANFAKVTIQMCDLPWEIAKRDRTTRPVNISAPAAFMCGEMLGEALEFKLSPPIRRRLEDIRDIYAAKLGLTR